MSHIFLELLQNLTTETLKGEIRPNKDFEQVVQNIERIYNPRNEPEYRLDPSKVCPIAASGSKLKYVIWGLNPHDDGEAGDLNHITTWEEMAEYHVPSPSNLSGDHTFSRVLYSKKINKKTGKHSYGVVNYYQNIAMLISSLEEGQLVKWSEFNKGLSPEKTKEKYLQMIEKTPIGVVEMIPFASKEIATSKEKLIALQALEPRMEKYLNALLEYILTESTDDAWIICNGSNACDAFEILLKSRDSSLVTATDLNTRNEKKYSLHFYNGKKILLLHHFLRKMGKLNSHEQIGAMIEHVSKAAGR